MDSYGLIVDTAVKYLGERVRSLRQVQAVTLGNIQSPKVLLCRYIKACFPTVHPHNILVIFVSLSIFASLPVGGRRFVAVELANQDGLPGATLFRALGFTFSPGMIDWWYGIFNERNE